MTTITFANQKGGVGKTTLAFNLAKGLAGRGHKILVIDNDPQGNLTSSFLDNPPSQLTANVLSLYDQEATPLTPQTVGEGLDLIGADISLSLVNERAFDVIFLLREGLQGIRENYDFILIDCLPSFGYLKTAALNATDHVLIPIKPAPYALQGLKDLLGTIGKVRERLNKQLQVLGMVLNMVEGKPTRLALEIEEVLRHQYPDFVFESVVNKAVKMEESPSFNQSIMEYEPRGKAAAQFGGFMDEFLSRLKKA
jgi:chromosome partitioning protein